MELKEARVQNYKCIEDSEWVEFEDVTSLVGKNESGKTAFLEALEKLNSVSGNKGYDSLQEYPRSRYTEYKRREDSDPDPVTSVKFELDDSEVQAVESQHGEGVLQSRIVTLTKNYKNKLQWDIQFEESQIVDELLDSHPLHNKTEESLRKADSIDELWEKVVESTANDEGYANLKNELNELVSEGWESRVGENILINHLPEFLYFDDYSIMEGDVYIQRLKNRRENGNLDEPDQTFLSLLSVANIDLDDLLKLDDYEEITAELEASSSHITQDVFKYWTQGPNLRVEFDPSQEYHRSANQNSQEKELVLHVRVKDQQHQVTLPFDDRSTGFIWFFSFLAYFSDMGGDDDDLILLLDEPGLNLHAKAQYDFLSFINDRLAPSHPVVYTTHSPFMLEPERLERAKLVLEDSSNEGEGTKITDDILRSDDDTVFPLQAALGYDLIQTLLLGPEVLLVEGKSDMTYLQIMSNVLERKGKTSLSHRWTIVPVSGADNVPTFVSLFGASDLKIGVLLDDDSQVQQRLDTIEGRRSMDMENVMTISDFVDQSEGDTEDLFSESFYTELVNDAFLPELRSNMDIPDEIDLESIDNQHPRITRRIEVYFNKFDLNDGVFSHQRPASHFQRNRGRFEDGLDEESLNRFEGLFEVLNDILEE